MAVASHKPGAVTTFCTLLHRPLRDIKTDQRQSVTSVAGEIFLYVMKVVTVATAGIHQRNMTIGNPRAIIQRDIETGIG